MQRPLKLAKYLPELGWSVHVLCPAHRRYPLLDPPLLEELPPSVTVHRVRGWEAADLADGLSFAGKWLADRSYWRVDRVQRCVMRGLGIPGRHLSWVLAARRAADRILRRQAFDLILTTSPPHEVHLVGRAVQRDWGIPWIADLRDPIVGNFADGERPDCYDRFYRRIESLVVRRADSVVTTCDELANDLASRHGLTGGDRAPRCITNGFDTADAPVTTGRSRPSEKPFIPGEPGMFDEPVAGRRSFVMAHVGSLYSGQRMNPVLAALELLARERPDVCGQLELRIVGAVSAALRRTMPIAPRANVAAIVETGYVAHRTALEHVAAADLLILVTPEGAGGRLCIPAKTFEYLAFGGHILAMVHPGTTLDRLLRRADGCAVLYDRSPAAIARALGDAYDRHLSERRPIRRDPAWLLPFDRRSVAERFSRLANQLLHARGASSECGLAEDRRATRCTFAGVDGPNEWPGSTLAPHRTHPL